MLSKLWDKVKPSNEFIAGWAIGGKVSLATYLSIAPLKAMAATKFPLAFKASAYTIEAVTVFGKKVVVAAVAAFNVA